MPYPDLMLYVRPGCGYCHQVLLTVRHLHLTVETRDIWQSQTAARELQQATGRQTVPVLRITEDSGAVQWMPESGDIIRYLQCLAQRG